MTPQTSPAAPAGALAPVPEALISPELPRPPTGPRAAISEAFANRRAVRYQLAGRLASSEHGTDDAFDYSSALNPVPGLTGVLR